MGLEHLRRQVVFGQMSRRFRDRDIQFKEIYAVLQAYSSPGPSMEACHVSSTWICCSSICAILWHQPKCPGHERAPYVVMLAAQLEFSFLLLARLC